jgi:hypothetical protein
MNYGRVLLAATGAFFAYFAIGFLVFGLLPLVREEFAKYPAIYRTQDSMKSVMLDWDGRDVCARRSLRYVVPPRRRHCGGGAFRRVDRLVRGLLILL